MSVTTIALRRAALGLACLATLVACSNAPDRRVTVLSIGKSIFSGKKAAKMPDAAQISNDAAKALAATDAPLILVTVPNRRAVTVMQELEQNRGYATYGTADRRSITMRGGLMTATRGLGNDIMSSRTDAVQALISARQNGIAAREMRYLDGEDLTQVRQLTCTIRITGKAARDDIPLTDVTEACEGDGDAFENTYKVSDRGTIVQSRQWHSPMNRYLEIQTLR